MRVLVCGDRNWDDRAVIGRVLQGLLSDSMAGFEILVVIEGCARGADDAAHHFLDGCTFPNGGSHASHDSVEHEHYPANWTKHGKAAGPIRNRQMLIEGQPDLVYAFHDDLASSKGTADMVRRSKAAGIPVYLVSRP